MPASNAALQPKQAELIAYVRDALAEAEQFYSSMQTGSRARRSRLAETLGLARMRGSFLFGRKTRHAPASRAMKPVPKKAGAWPRHPWV